MARTAARSPKPRFWKRQNTARSRSERLLKCRQVPEEPKPGGWTTVGEPPLVVGGPLSTQRFDLTPDGRYLLCYSGMVVEVVPADKP